MLWCNMKPARPWILAHLKIIWQCSRSSSANFWNFVKNDKSNKGTTARLNETRFGPKKMSSPIYLGPKNRDTFWCTGWAWTLPDNFQMREYSWPCRQSSCRSFIRFIVLYEIPKVNFRVETKFLVSMSEEI
jgi:hypothetical protein